MFQYMDGTSWKILNKKKIIFSSTLIYDLAFLFELNREAKEKVVLF